MLPIFHEVSACSVHLSLVSVHLVPFCLFPFALRHSRYSLRSSFVPQASGTNRREPKVRGARQGTDDWRGLVSLCRPRFRPFPPSLSSLRRSVPHALVRSSRRSLGSSLPPERRDGRMTGRSEGGKEPRTTVRPLRVSLSRSVRTSLTSPSETRSAHFARSCLRRE